MNHESLNSPCCPVSSSCINTLARTVGIHRGFPRPALGPFGPIAQTQGATCFRLAPKWTVMLAVLSLRLHVQWSQIFGPQRSAVRRQWLACISVCFGLVQRGCNDRQTHSTVDERRAGV